MLYVLNHDRMKEYCEGHSTMRDHGMKFVETVKHLLQLLLEYRAVITDENHENMMSCTVSLLVSQLSFIIFSYNLNIKHDELN